MAYAVKYTVTHKTYVAGNQSTYLIEILQDGFGGSSTELQGAGGAGVFSLEFERIEREQLLRGVAQKGRLELYLAIRDSTDFAVLTEIFDSDEDEYKMRLKVDGSVKWTGFVIPDMLQYEESGYPQQATIAAKDLSLIEAEDFETNTAISRQLYITTLAGILNTTDLDLAIHTYNDWTAANISSGDDYFNQVHIDKYQLQNFSSFSSGSFEAISKLDALNEIIPPGFLLRQYDNVWNLFAIDYLAREGASAKRYEYNASGSQTGSTSSVDLTEDVDEDDNFLLGSSVNKPWPGVKRLDLAFNHKTSIQHILFDTEYDIPGSSQFLSETIKVSNVEDRIIEISGSVEVTTDTDPASLRTGDAQLLVSVDDYEYDLSSRNWGISTGVQDVSVSGSDNTLTGSFSGRATANIPSDVDESEIVFEMRWASVSGETVQSVVWSDLSFKLVNGGPVADGAANNFRLTQSGRFSSKKILPTIIIGQGPDDLSHSALRYFSVGGTYELLSDFENGTGTAYQYEQFVMQNMMNLQRTPRESIDADLYALYSPRNILVYDSKNYLFLDGVLNGLSRWNGTMIELNWETGSDTFEEFVKIGDSDSGTVVAPSSGSSSTGDFDNRYFKQASLLSEASDLPTLYGNIGLDDGSADLDLSSLDINGSSFVDSSRNVSANEGTFSGDVTWESNSAFHIRLDRTSNTNVDHEYSIGVSDQDGILLYNFTDSEALAIFRHNSIQFNQDLTFSGDLELLSDSDTFISVRALTTNTYNKGIDFLEGSSGFGTGGTFGMRVWYDPVDNTGNISMGNASTVIDAIGVARDSGAVTLTNTLTINSQRLFTLGNEQLLSTDANVQFNEVDIGGNWKLDSESEGGIERLRIQALGVDDGAELFIQSKGSADLARITLTPDPSPSNYSFVTLESNGSHQIINSSSEGTESTLPLSIRIDGTEALGVDTSRNLTTHANIADDGFSDWFSANPAGYEIAGATGVADFRTVLTDELVAKAFTADVAQALAGSDILTKSVGILAEDFTIPAVSSSDTIVIEDLEGLGDFQAFEANDWLRIRIVDRTSSPAVIGDVYGQVTSYSDNADGTQDWTFTVDYAGTSDVLVGQTVYKGAVILDYGTSGDTFIERTVLDRSGTSDFTKVPYDRIVQWTNGGSGGPRPSEATYEVLTQIGNINGLGGFSSATYGAYFKDNLVLEIGNGDMTIGKNVGPSDEDGIFIDSDDYWFSDGTGSVGDGILNWDASVPEVNLATFTANDEYMSDGNVFFGELTGVSMPSDSIRVGKINSVPIIRLTSGGTTLIQLDAGGGADGALFRNSAGNTVARFGSQNFIAGINFDNSKLFTGDATDGYVGLGATSGATDRAFWAGADNADGSGSAGLYIKQNGTMVLDTDAKITNNADEFRIDSNGISFEEGDFGSQRLQWMESTFSTVRSELYYDNRLIVDTNNQFELRIDGTQEYNFDNDRLDLNLGTNKVLKLPHLTDGERNAFSAEEGDMIYNTTANGIQFYDGTQWVGS